MSLQANPARKQPVARGPSELPRLPDSSPPGSLTPDRTPGLSRHHAGHQTHKEARPGLRGPRRGSWRPQFTPTLWMRTLTFSRGHRVAKPPRGSGVSPRKLAQPRAPRRPPVAGGSFPRRASHLEGKLGRLAALPRALGLGRTLCVTTSPLCGPCPVPGGRYLYPGLCSFLSDGTEGVFHSLTARGARSHSGQGRNSVPWGGPTPVPSAVPGNGHLRVTCVPAPHGDAPPSCPPPRAPPRDCDGPLQPSPPPMVSLLCLTPGGRRAGRGRLLLQPGQGLRGGGFSVGGRPPFLILQAEMRAGVRLWVSPRHR